MEKNRSRFGLKMLVMPTIILLLVSFYPLLTANIIMIKNRLIFKLSSNCRLFFFICDTPNSIPL